MPDLPKLPDLPEMPDLPKLPDLPELPDLSELPNLPQLPFAGIAGNFRQFATNLPEIAAICRQKGHPAKIRTE